MCRQMIHFVHTNGSQRISRRFSMATREDIVSPTRTAHSNYGQSVRQSPLHTGQVEPLLSQDDCWFPWAKFRNVGGSQHVHGNVWCTWRYSCCWSGSPLSSDSQGGHAGENMYILGYVSIKTLRPLGMELHWSMISLLRVWFWLDSSLCPVPHSGITMSSSKSCDLVSTLVHTSVYKAYTLYILVYHSI